MSLAACANAYDADWSDIWDYQIDCEACGFAFESTLQWDGDYWTAPHSAWNVCPKCLVRQALELTDRPDEPVRPVDFGEAQA